MWLMRQAGRYMAAFRECVALWRPQAAFAPRSPLPARYSDKYPFRQRSETPEIALELSLQARARASPAAAC